MTSSHGVFHESAHGVRVESAHGVFGGVGLMPYFYAATLGFDQLRKYDVETGAILWTTTLTRNVWNKQSIDSRTAGRSKIILVGDSIVLGYHDPSGSRYTHVVRVRRADGHIYWSFETDRFSPGAICNLPGIDTEFMAGNSRRLLLDGSAVWEVNWPFSKQSFDGTTDDTRSTQLNRPHMAGFFQNQYTIGKFEWERNGVSNNPIFTSEAEIDPSNGDILNWSAVKQGYTQYSIAGAGPLLIDGDILGLQGISAVVSYLSSDGTSSQGLPQTVSHNSYQTYFGWGAIEYQGQFYPANPEWWFRSSGYVRQVAQDNRIVAMDWLRDGRVIANPSQPDLFELEEYAVGNPFQPKFRGLRVDFVPEGSFPLLPHSPTCGIIGTDQMVGCMFDWDPAGSHTFSLGMARLDAVSGLIDVVWQHPTDLSFRPLAVGELIYE